MNDKSHILIVDDELMNIELMSEILDSEGYITRSVLTGREAIDTARDVPVDLVLLDVNMPGMDGFEVCKQFKDDDKLRDIPIIFLSAADRTADTIKGFKVGGVDYIVKPCYPDEVLVRIETHLSLRNAQRQLQVQNTQLQMEIARRQEAEVELRKREALLAQAQQLAHLGNWEWDIINDITTWSDELYRIYGLDPQTYRVTRLSYLDQIHPDDREMAKKANDDRLLSSESIQFTHRHIHPDETIRTLLSEGQAVLDSAGTPIRMFGIVQDITERQQLQDALEESEQRYRQIIENASEAVFTTDLLGFFTYANPVMLKRSGYTTEEELVDKHFTDLIDEAWRERVLKFYQKQFVERTHETVLTFPLHKTKDEQIWVEQTTNLIMDGEKITGFLGITRDITKRKKLEAERERLIAELDAFAHTVAHDLKSPLSILTIYSEMLEMMSDQMSEEKRNNALQLIRQGALKMSDIINALLLLASVRKKDDISIDQLDMVHIVGEAVERLNTQIIQYEVECIIPDTFPSALGYAPWVEEVWVNYISNAIKYGGKPPYIEVGADTLVDGSICFWVKDNGIGLSPEDQTKLFTPFTRLNQIDVEGHGLGLSIVQRIAEKLSGTVGVESENGGGSKFYFTLPTI